MQVEPCVLTYDFEVCHLFELGIGIKLKYKGIVSTFQSAYKLIHNEVFAFAFVSIAHPMQTNGTVHK